MTERWNTEQHDTHWTPVIRGHLPALDGLRGIAILLVIVSHYLGDYWRAATIGWTGVNLFFVLSGFLITGILLDAKGKSGYFRNFYARRTLRIFPLYYLSLILIFGLGALIPALNTEGFRHVAENQGWLWTYLMNVYVSFNATLGGENPFAGDWVQTLHFWSLAVEEQFYLIWPAIVLACSRKGLAWMCGTCIIGAWGLRAWFVLVADNTIAPYYFMPCRMDDIAVGAVVALIARKKGGLERLAVFVPWLMGASLLMLAAGWNKVGHFFQLDGTVQLMCYTPFAILYGCLLVFALSRPANSFYIQFLNLAVLRSYGKYSYAIYVVHWVLSDLLFARVAPLEGLTEVLGSQTAALLFRWGVVAAVSYFIAFAIWHLFEKHFLKLKSRFYSS